MKQLLHHCGPHLIIALNDRAYLLINHSISCSSSKDTNDAEVTTTATNPASDHNCSIVELLNPSMDTNNNNTNNTNGNDNGNDNGNGNDNEKSVEKKKKTKKKKKQNVNNENNKQNEIQAVSVIQQQHNDNENNSNPLNHLICAVSRMDKSLSIYSVPLSNINIQSMEAYWTYSTNKRCSSLAFATLPSPTTNIPKNDTKHTKNKPTVILLPIIIITADLTGDVFAYPILCPSYVAHTKLNPHKDHNQKKESSSNSIQIRKRLLLGHSTSMLTSIKVANDIDPQTCTTKIKNLQNLRQRIITSDRDEKIRVSLFPQTHVLERFLLGHTEFISCLDISSNTNVSRCVSGSGDGTVRLWDYNQALENSNALLYCLQPMKKENEVKDSSLSLSATQSKQQQSQEPSIQQQQQKYQLNYSIPSAISMSQDGTIVAIARDSCNTVQILHFANHTTLQGGETNNTEMETNTASTNRIQLLHQQNITCSAQPLSLIFLPNQNNNNHNNGDEIQNNNESLFILTSDINNVLLHYVPIYTSEKGEQGKQADKVENAAHLPQGIPHFEETLDVKSISSFCSFHQSMQSFLSTTTIPLNATATAPAPAPAPAPTNKNTDNGNHELNVKTCNETKTTPADATESKPQTSTNTKTLVDILQMPKTVMEYKNENETSQRLKMLRGKDPIGFHTTNTPSVSATTTTHSDEDKNNKMDIHGENHTNSTNNNNNHNSNVADTSVEIKPRATTKWNNSRERKEKDRLKQARIRKRKREANANINTTGQDGVNDDMEENKE